MSICSLRLKSAIYEPTKKVLETQKMQKKREPNQINNI